ncbi:MAG: hypothetical protein MN733_21105 [Nitrososphaera sp.]|nr:hypothetical protein [Nitrososphaera sp.]
MYVKYRIQEHDTNDNRPFEMTIYFREQVDGDWMAPTFVVDQGRVINGTLKLAENMQALSGGGGTPPEMSTYISAYHGSLHWLDAFTTKSEPLSLTAGSWGKTASIGGSEIKPSGTEKVSFEGAQDLCQADSCDSTLVMWHKGVDSKIWVVNEFPYPVKALTFADVTTGQAPIQFAFELLETGTGQPEMPATADQVPTPPLGPKATPRGTYEVEIDWEPMEIRPNTPVVFGVTLTDSTGFPLERVNYDLTVRNGGGAVVQEFKNQNAELGTGTHEVTFEESGSMTVTVTINSISGVPAGGGTFTEAVDFNIRVVPEFPVSAAIIAAGVVGMVVLVSRLRGNGVSSIFGTRNEL